MAGAARALAVGVTQTVAEQDVGTLASRGHVQA